MSETRLPWWRTLRSIAILGVLAGLAACSGTGGTDTGGVDTGGDVGDVAVEGGPEAAPDSDLVAEDRQVITTAFLTLVVADARESADEATRIVEAVGGRVDDRSEDTGFDDDRVSADLTVRIPADRLSETLEELKAIGEVDALQIRSEDVTLQVTDLDARIAALEVSIARLQDLMSGATSTADLLAAEAALTERQAELDSIRAQRTYLGEQVALATVHLSLLPAAAAPSPAPGGFWGGVQTGWSALVTALNRAIVAVGVVLPWVLVAGVVVAVVFLVRRARPRRLHVPLPPAGGAPPASAAPLGPQQPHPVASHPSAPRPPPGEPPRR